MAFLPNLEITSNQSVFPRSVQGPETQCEKQDEREAGYEHGGKAQYDHHMYLGWSIHRGRVSLCLEGIEAEQQQEAQHQVCLRKRDVGTLCDFYLIQSLLIIHSLIASFTHYFKTSRFNRTAA